MLSYSIRVIVEHKFLYCQGVSVAGNGSPQRARRTQRKGWGRELQNENEGVRLNDVGATRRVALLLCHSCLEQESRCPVNQIPPFLKGSLAPKVLFPTYFWSN